MGSFQKTEEVYDPTDGYRGEKVIVLLPGVEPKL